MRSTIKKTRKMRTLWVTTTLLLSSPVSAFFRTSSAKRVHAGTAPAIQVVGAILQEVKTEGGIRFRGRVAYDGTGFNGWQTQSKGRTVQAELEEVLSRRFNRRVTVVGAGRTDAGVHARGQAFHFELRAGEIDTKEDELKLQRAMNSMLRRDARVWKVSRAPAAIEKFRDDGSIAVHKWHVIYESTKKLYSYR